MRMANHGRESRYRYQNVRRQSSKKRRKRGGWDYQKIAMMGGAAIVVIISLIFTIKGIAGLFKGSGKEAEQTQALVETTEVPLEKNVFVDDIVITGMSKTEAKETLTKSYTWDLKARLNGSAGNEVYEIRNLIEPKIDELIERIYATPNPEENYSLDFSGLDAEIQAEVAAMAEKWNIKAKNGSITGFDKTTNSFVYSNEENGLEIDEVKLTKDIQEALATKNFKTVITVLSETVPAEITRDQAKAMYKVIGAFTTTTTSNKDRNTNIRLACEALDGMILHPGETFSFNKTTGNRTLERGYKPAGAYLNGVLVAEPGGGVCQVSSTLYNAVVFAGLQPTERHAHTFEPSYVTPGEDAMVSYDGYDGPDMKFLNTSDTAIALRAKLVDQKLTVSVVGIPILAEGEKIAMSSKKIQEMDSPAPQYEEDDTITKGTEVLAKEGTKGSRWETNIVKTKNGEVVSSAFFHNSTYKGKAPIVRRNTDAVASSGGVIDPLAAVGTETVESDSMDGSLGAIIDEASPTATIDAHSGPDSDNLPAESTRSPESARSRESVSPGQSSAAQSSAAQPAHQTSASSQSGTKSSTKAATSTAAQTTPAPAPTQVTTPSQTNGPAPGGDEETIPPLPSNP